jgi:putative endonuclease
MMANRKNGAIYTGVTSNLIKRTHEHRNGTGAVFTRRYACKLLVWYEQHETMPSAIAREKQLKAGSRAAKCILIAQQNPEWHDLYDSLF